MSFLVKRQHSLEDRLEDIFFKVFTEVLRIPARCCRSLTMVWSLENHLYLLTLDHRAIVNLNCLATRLIALDIVKLCMRFIKKLSTREHFDSNFLISNFFLSVNF